MSDVHSIITDRIVHLLEPGVVPWHKPWQGGERLPRNLVTLDNSAVYVGAWWQRLRNDTKLVVQAAAQAQKANRSELRRWRTSS